MTIDITKVKFLVTYTYLVAQHSIIVTDFNTICMNLINLKLFSRIVVW